MRKATRTNTYASNKQHALKNPKAVKVVLIATESQVSSFIQVQIEDGNITIVSVK